MSDAKFREVTVRALERMGLPSIGHVMIRMGNLETALRAIVEDSGVPQTLEQFEEGETYRQFAERERPMVLVSCRLLLQAHDLLEAK